MITQFLPPRLPLLKAGLTSGCIMLVGDAMAQRVARPAGQREELDLKRMGTFGIVGLTLHGPFFFTGMRAIDHGFGPSKAFSNVIRKTFTAQAVLFPPFIALLFGWVGVLEGKSLQQCKEKIKNNYPSAFLAGSFFWPAANLVNFRFISSSQRILYTSLAGLIWNTFISWTNARSNSQPITTLRGVGMS